MMCQWKVYDFFLKSKDKRTTEKKRKEKKKG
jgi:hypothetical protein